MYGYSREKIDVGHPFGLKGLINASLMAIYLSHQHGCCGEV